MGIRQRKEVAGQPWVYDYKDPATGKRKLATPKSGLKKDALALKKQIDLEIANGIHTPKSDSITVGRLAEAFLQDLEQRRKDKRISAGYEQNQSLKVRKYLIPALGAKLLVNVTIEDVLKLYRDMVNSGLQPHIARDNIAAFGRIENLAVRRELTRRRVFKDAASELRGIGRGQIRIFTLADVQKLIAVSGQVRKCERRRQDVRNQAWLHLAVNLAAFCGLRWGEIFGLTLSSLDFDANVIRVRRSLQKTSRGNSYALGKGTKTAAGKRDIPMPEHIRGLLMEWCQRHYLANPDQIVFTLGAKAQPGFAGEKVGTRAGGPIKPQSFHSHWTRLLDAAGLNSEDGKGGLHFHALRHFASALMVEHHIPLTDVAGLMGHKSFDLTLQVYAHSIVGGHTRHTAFESMSQSVNATIVQLEPLSP